MPPLDRRPLRDEIRDLLTTELMWGKLKPDRPISLSSISEELGVSRTPVREALIALEQEGLVRSEQGTGFVATPLNKDRARDLYQLIAALEKLALSWSGAFDEEQLERLRSLDGERATEDDPHRLVRLDMEWHRALVAGCRNDWLRQILHNVRIQLYRYEFAYMSEASSKTEALKEHRHIRRLLEDGQVKKAADHLPHHWAKGLNFLKENIASTR